MLYRDSEMMCMIALMKDCCAADSEMMGVVAWMKDAELRTAGLCA